MLLLIQMPKSIHHLITLLLVFIFVSSPLMAQQRRNATPAKPAPPEASEPLPTFDTLLSADTYKVYCEVRAVGGLIRSSAVNDLLDPVMKLGGPPKEFKTIVKWLNAHADILAGSRMLVAGWPTRPKTPSVLVAIEFSSVEEAKKFYPELRDFLPTLLPTPTPTPEPTPTPTPPPASKPTRVVSVGGLVVQPDPILVPVARELKPIPEQQPTPALPPYQMQQSGSLVLISDTAFTLRNLRPRGSKSLEEDQNFLLARNRFASESIFLYVDVKSIEKEEKDKRQKWEKDEQTRVEAETANPPKAEEPLDSAEQEVTAAKIEQSPPAPEPSDSSQPTLVATVPDPQAHSDATLSGAPQGTEEVGPAFSSLYGALFGGQSKWPEAVAAALVFEGDAYVVRTLILNSEENKNLAVPFLPQFVSGPALVPESPNIFPSDTDLFVSVSLDYPQIYEGMVKAIAQAEEESRKYRPKTVRDAPPTESPLAMYEKKLGLKIKDDLLPLLGHEIALVLPKRAPKAAPDPKKPDSDAKTDKPVPETEAQTNATGGATSPVLAISVKDKEAVARLIPKLIESFGLKGANLLAQTEKRDGTEITSYAGVFAYAFVGDFLVVSPDVAATRHVVDSYLNHDTLSSNTHFRNFTRWQPRQVLGQVYVAPGLVQQYTSGSAGPFAVDEQFTGYLSGMSPVIDPLTYALSNDGLGPLHELRVPRNLLQLIIAGASREAGKPPLAMNEAMAQTALRSLAGSEAEFKSDKGDGRYGSLDELISESLISRESLEKYGYRIELTVSGDKFEATAVPVDYGITGRLSYFIDESGVLRGGDRGGGAATVADQPVN